jgi:histidinol dehydrogenase
VGPTEALLIAKAFAEAAALIVDLVAQAKGEDLTPEQIEKIEQARKTAEDRWAALAPKAK